MNSRRGKAYKPKYKSTQLNNSIFLGTEAAALAKKCHPPSLLLFLALACDWTCAHGKATVPALGCV